MLLKILHLGSTSLTFEIRNAGCYYCPRVFDVMLDGEVAIKGEKRNVFSLFNLKPASKHEVEIRFGNESIHRNFITKKEAAVSDVRLFGAIGDGKHDDTAAIQLAIYCCPEHGRVVVSPGTYVITSLQMKSHFTLELAKGATLLGAKKRSLFPYLPPLINYTNGKDMPLGTWEGVPAPMFGSLILGVNVSDVAIVGQGTIDGNGKVAGWWVNPKLLRTAWRPRDVFFNHCTHVVLQGLTIQNSPAWSIHPFYSQHLKLLDLEVKAAKKSPNTDGCDAESCSDVMIIGSHFSVGEDCIALKSGKKEMAEKYHTPCQNITIRNCRMNDGHGAVVLGSETGAGIRNLHVSNCRFENTDRGLRIKTRRGRGQLAVVDGVTFRHIVMDGVLTPFVMNMFYNCDPIDGKSRYVYDKKKLPINDGTPYLGKFRFIDIQCRNAQVCAGFFIGLPERRIASIALKRVSVSFKDKAKTGVPAMMSFIRPMKKKGFCFTNVEEVILNDVVINGQEGEALSCKHVGHLVGALSQEEKK